MAFKTINFAQLPASARVGAASTEPKVIVRSNGQIALNTCAFKRVHEHFGSPKAKDKDGDEMLLSGAYGALLAFDDEAMADGKNPVIPFQFKFIGNDDKAVFDAAVAKGMYCPRFPRHPEDAEQSGRSIVFGASGLLKFVHYDYERAGDQAFDVEFTTEKSAKKGKDDVLLAVFNLAKAPTPKAKATRKKRTTTATVPTAPAPAMAKPATPAGDDDISL